MAKHTIEILPPMSFSPASIQITIGDTVEWVSKDPNDIHTVTHTDGTTFASGELSNGATFEHTFTEAGSVAYFCEVHGKDAMFGTVDVLPATAARHTVEILPPMSYSPPLLSIKPGDTVEWVSKDANDIHTVTHDDQTTFRSELLNGGDTFEHTFTAAGDFPYFCEVHGPGMAGLIKVS